MVENDCLQNDSGGYFDNDGFQNLKFVINSFQDLRKTVLATAGESFSRFYQESWSSFFSEYSHIDISQKASWIVVGAMCGTGFGPTCVIVVGL